MKCLRSAGFHRLKTKVVRGLIALNGRRRGAEALLGTSQPIAGQPVVALKSITLTNDRFGLRARLRLLLC